MKERKWLDPEFKPPKHNGVYMAVVRPYSGHELLDVNHEMIFPADFVTGRGQKLDPSTDVLMKVIYRRTSYRTYEFYQVTGDLLYGKVLAWTALKEENNDDQQRSV